MSESRELEVWQRVAALAQSPSHDFHHINRVQHYADELGRVLGVETDLVRLAAILHDLGRGDEKRRHGLSSIEASKEMAQEVLRHLDLSDDARRTVIEAIESHDQPDLNPASPEGRILKDADFLAGFGAWGVLRIAMWSGETGRRLEQVLNAITVGMQRRLKSLEFPESRVAATREVLFAREFNAELQRPIQLGSPKRTGFYCLLEGISGTGKNTIAKALCSRLEANRVKHRFVEEPSKTFRTLRDQLQPNALEFVPVRKALLMADRADQVNRVVNPALLAGEIVISVRSYLSTAVYQSADRSDAYRTLREHDWVPRADLLLVLNVDVDTAMSRIGNRDKPAGDFETAEHLTLHRKAYLELAESFPSIHTEVLDTSDELEDVKDRAFRILSRQLESTDS